MANPLVPKVELFYDSAWQDITTYVMVRDASGLVDGSRGRPNEASQTEPSIYTLIVNNRDGRFSPRNPLSPLYGKIGRNTPIRVSVGTDVRFVGEVLAWPQRWDTTGADVWVPIEAAGILRRLGQGDEPLHSAMYREITSRASIGGLPFTPVGLVAYWPCEDGPESTSIASAIGGPPMVIEGTPDLAAYTPIAASGLIPIMGTAAFNGTVPRSIPTGELLIRFHAAFPSGGSSNGQIFGIRTTGTAQLWVINYVSGSGGQCILRVYDFENTELHNSGNISAALDGVESNFSLQLFQDGSDVDYQFRVRRVAADGTVSEQTLTTGTVTNRSIGRAVRCSAAYGQNQTETAIGHIAIADDVGLFFGLNRAITGHRGETAGNRISRLCSEEGVTFTSAGDLDDTAAMGPQRIDTFLSLLREAADADLGILYEPRASLGLAYRTRVDLLNQTPVLELDYTDGVFSSIPEPVDDDQQTRNDVTVKRPEGSEARAVDEDGPLSVQAPPDGIGQYATSIEVNVVGDEFLQNQAAWRVALGTVDEARYPRLPIHIHNPIVAGDATLKANIIAVDGGDRITIDNMPTWVSHNLVDLIVLAVRERFNGFLWFVEFVCAPYVPYLVGEYESAEGGDYRYDTAGSSLTSNFVAGTDTSMSVDVDVLPLWTTDGDEVPFDIEVGGVRLTVTAISGASSPQTFTITQTPVNGVEKTIPAGTSVLLWTKARYAL